VNADFANPTGETMRRPNTKNFSRDVNTSLVGLVGPFDGRVVTPFCPAVSTFCADRSPVPSGEPCLSSDVEVVWTVGLAPCGGEAKKGVSISANNKYPVTAGTSKSMCEHVAYHTA